MVSSYANFLEQKKVFTWEKFSIPTGFSWYTNMAAVTSCENDLYHTNAKAFGESISHVEYMLISLRN